MRLDKRKIAFSVIGVCLFLFLASGIRAQGSLQITNPASGTTLSPGQTVVVDVTASGGPFNGIMIVAPEDINVDTVLSSPPYEFSFTIPSQVTPGLTTIGALGLSASGPVTTEIQVDIERPDSPQTITTDTSQLELAVGDSVPVQVFGTYADGTMLRLTNSTQTTYLSQAPSVAGVSPYGIVTAVAPGSTQIIVNGMVSVSVIVDPPIVVLPATATLVASQTRNFIAPTSGLASTEVTFSLNPGYGSVDANGIYTAPAAVASQETDTLTATSVADNTQTASAVITLLPTASVTILPAWAVLYASEPQQFTATTSNAGTAGVTWSVSPSGAGTIDGTGLYTAPASISSTQPVTITAASVANPTIAGSTTIYISPQPFNLLPQLPLVDVGLVC